MDAVCLLCQLITNIFHRTVKLIPYCVAFWSFKEQKLLLMLHLMICVNIYNCLLAITDQSMYVSVFEIWLFTILFVFGFESDLNQSVRLSCKTCKLWQCSAFCRFHYLIFFVVEKVAPSNEMYYKVQAVVGVCTRPILYQPAKMALNKAYNRRNVSLWESASVALIVIKCTLDAPIGSPCRISFLILMICSVTRLDYQTF